MGSYVHMNEVVHLLIFSPSFCHSTSVIQKMTIIIINISMKNLFHVKD